MNCSMNSQSFQYRYERKWQFLDSSLSELKTALKLHPAIFREIYKPRWVNNIYLDTYDQQSFYDNDAGIGRRSKCRIRWYGVAQGEIVNPQLEFKNKTADVGTKLQYSLKDFCFSSSFNRHYLQEVLTRSQLPDSVLELTNHLTPALHNRYYRSYYLSIDGNYRATIDSELSFAPLHQLRAALACTHHDHDSIILELKYSSQLEEEARLLTKHLPTNFHKHSKFIRGLEAFLW